MFRYYLSKWYRNIILKARQYGFTTFDCLYALDTAIWTPGIACGIIAHNLDDAKKIFATKIKAPYDWLDEDIRIAVKAKTDRVDSLELSNGSRIDVSTSFRSGTVQILHVSEMGKIAAKYPDKAQEIKTGAFEAAGKHAQLCMESTAEGRAGFFYDQCMDAMRLQQSRGMDIGQLDWRFFFHPWFRDPEYALPREGARPMPPALTEYFAKLGKDQPQFQISPEQQIWYASKWRVLGDLMKREYPATPREAFEASLEGAYFAYQMARAREEGRVPDTLPVHRNIGVETWWDYGSGASDLMAIWMTQRVGRWCHVIGYYDNHSQGWDHYKKYLDDWAAERGVTFVGHHAPHDIVHPESTGKTRLESAAAAGIAFDWVPRTDSKWSSIQAARSHIDTCWFDATACERGISGLDEYRKEWDEHLGDWSDKPHKSWARHPADAFQTLAMGYDQAALNTPRARPVVKRRRVPG